MYDEKFPPDEELIERFRRGDPRAFDALVRRYERKIYQYAYRLTQNADDAADVVAETFVRMYHSLKGFRGEASLSTWLYRIVSHVFFDFRKRQRAHAHEPWELLFAGEETQERPLADDMAERMEEHALEQERWRVLQEAINRLPEYQRVMVVLFHIEERSYEEIAQMTRLPLGTVKSRLNRARAALKELLRPHWELFGYEEGQTEQQSSEEDHGV